MEVDSKLTNYSKKGIVALKANLLVYPEDFVSQEKSEKFCRRSDCYCFYSRLTINYDLNKTSLSNAHLFSTVIFLWQLLSPRGFRVRLFLSWALCFFV